MKFFGLALFAILIGNIYGKDDPCSLPIEIGFCKGAFPKFGYDPKEGCIEFAYGGCDGNANNFNTLEECKAACEAVSTSPGPKSGDLHPPSVQENPLPLGRRKIGYSNVRSFG